MCEVVSSGFPLLGPGGYRLLTLFHNPKFPGWAVVCVGHTACLPSDAIYGPPTLPNAEGSATESIPYTFDNAPLVPMPATGIDMLEKAGCSRVTLPLEEADKLGTDDAIRFG